MHGDAIYSTIYGEGVPKIGEAKYPMTQGYLDRGRGAYGCPSLDNPGMAKILGNPRMLGHWAWDIHLYILGYGCYDCMVLYSELRTLRIS